MRPNRDNESENSMQIESCQQNPDVIRSVHSREFILSLGKILTVAVLSLTSLVQCGKKSEDPIAKNFAAVLVNPQPLVRFTNQTRNGRQITAPWFELEMKLQNTSSRNVKIDEIEFYVTVNGTELKSQSLDFGSLDRTVGDDAVITFDNYCIYPNDSVAYYLAACATGWSNPNPTVQPAYVVSPLRIILDGLGDKDKIVNFAFPVRAVLRGASLDSSGIEVDRFSKTITFTTR